MKLPASFISLLATATISFAVQVAYAADSAPSPRAADSLAPARAQIAAKNWGGAIDALKRIDEPASADWNNLMGYSLRKQPQPDLEGSERHYDAALRIDPNHRGTLEYSGELYLMKGDLARAEQRLATLDKVCTFGCAEYSELKRSIARHKAGTAVSGSGSGSTY